MHLNIIETSIQFYAIRIWCHDHFKCDIEKEVLAAYTICICMFLPK